MWPDHSDFQKWKREILEILAKPIWKWLLTISLVSLLINKKPQTSFDNCILHIPFLYFIHVYWFSSNWSVSKYS